MQITRQADYALRAIIFLSKLSADEKASTSVIAEEKKIPPSFLAKIISQLSIAGIIHTSRGARGGVSLARPPEDISVLDIIEAIDGPILLNECTVNPDNCPFGRDCELHEIWKSTREDLVEKLGAVTFSRFSSVLVD